MCQLASIRPAAFKSAIRMQPEKMFPCSLRPGHGRYGGRAAQSDGGSGVEPREKLGFSHLLDITVTMVAVGATYYSNVT